ncbi:SLATT domain-containing protein [Fredinandcohnia salidurans]|uniref:SLATT domain-containing protein n=1 Tax=Fredinandcohnia salidurans TaxID=2595041 RepID=A0ABW4MN80_9BACI
MQKKIGKLKRKVWLTRKARIIASERLKEKHDFHQTITVYYSVWMVFFSIINVNSDSTNTVSLLVLSSSVALSLFSLFVNSKNYQERYFNLKANYIMLDKLITELEDIEEKLNNAVFTNFNNEIILINEKYNNTLSTVENHDEIDFLMVLNTPNTGERSLTFEEMKRLNNYKRKQIFFKSIFYALPFLMIVIFGVINYFNIFG